MSILISTNINYQWYIFYQTHKSLCLGHPGRPRDLWQGTLWVWGECLGSTQHPSSVQWCIINYSHWQGALGCSLLDSSWIFSFLSYQKKYPDTWRKERVGNDKCRKEGTEKKWFNRKGNVDKEAFLFTKINVKMVHESCSGSKSVKENI